MIYKNFLLVQWLGLCAFRIEDVGSIPDENYVARPKKVNKQYVSKIKSFLKIP